MTDLSQLSDEEVNDLLGPLAGYEAIEEPDSPGYWCVIHRPSGRQYGYRNGLNERHAIACLRPKFCSSLDECAKVFRSFAMGLGRCERFDEILKSIVERDFRKREAASDPTLLVCDLYTTHATARQWAEALIQLLEEIATLQP